MPWAPLTPAPQGMPGLFEIMASADNPVLLEVERVCLMAVKGNIGQQVGLVQMLLDRDYKKPLPKRDIEPMD